MTTYMSDQIARGPIPGTNEGHSGRPRGRSSFDTHKLGRQSRRAGGILAFVAWVLAILVFAVGAASIIAGIGEIAASSKSIGPSANALAMVGARDIVIGVGLLLLSLVVWAQSMLFALVARYVGWRASQA